MITIILKAIWRTVVVFFFAVFLLIVVLLITKSSLLGALAFPVGVWSGIFASMLDDMQRRPTWTRPKRRIKRIPKVFPPAR